MGVKSFLAGKSGFNEQLPVITPEQQGYQSWLLQQGQQGIGQNQPFDFNPIRQQAMEQFRTETVPSIADRFLGTSSTRNSGGFQGALGAAGAGLETNLAALKAQYDYQSHNQQQQNALNMLGMGMHPTYENIYTPASSGLLGGLASGVAPALGKYGALAGAGALGLGPWAAGAGGAALGNAAAGTAGGAAGSAALPLAAGAAGAAAIPAVAGATGTPAAAGATGAAAKTAGAAGLAKGALGAVGALGASGALPLAATAGAALFGIKKWKDKKKFNKDWEEARLAYMAGRRPYPPASKPKAFYAEEAQIGGY